MEPADHMVTIAGAPCATGEWDPRGPAYAVQEMTDLRTIIVAGSGT